MSSPASDPPSIPWVTLGAALGATVALWLVPSWIPAIAGSLAGAEPRGFWYLSRVSGLVAYALVWLSVVVGLLQSTGLARAVVRPPVLIAVHRQSAIAGLAFVALHAAVLLGDRYVGADPFALAVPFAMSRHAPGWVGLGQLALYGAIVVAVSFRLRGRIGARAWRALHFASFTVFALVVAHAVGAGSDAAEPWLVASYASTVAVVGVLTAMRFSMLRDRPARGRDLRAPAARSGASPRAR